MTDKKIGDLKDAETFTDVKNALAQYQDALETKNDATQKNIEKFLAEYEEKAAEFAAEFAAVKKAKEGAEDRAKLADELGVRVKDLEVALAKKGSGSGSGTDDRESDTYKNFMAYIQKGENADIDLKALRQELNVKGTLRTDVDSQGGFLLPNVMDGELRKNITEISPVRQFARGRTMPSKSMEITRRGSNLGVNGAPFEGELEQDDTGISAYVQENVTAFRQSWTIPVTKDLLLSSAFNVEQEMISDVFEHFAVGESRNFLLGTGHKGPKGIITDTRCEVVASAAAGQLGTDDFAEIAGQLKRGYNPWFFMNRRTLAEIWKLKGSDGHPIWQPVPAGGATPATIFTFPYNSGMIHMDDHVPSTNNTKPLMFADLARGYEIYDLAGTEVIRDDYTQKRKAAIEFTFHRYLTGQVILPEAIKILNVT